MPMFGPMFGVTLLVVEVAGFVVLYVVLRAVKNYTMKNDKEDSPPRRSAD